MTRFGHRDAWDAHGLDIADVVQRKEPSVGRDDVRDTAEDFAVLLNGRYQQFGIVLGHHGDIGNKTPFGFLHLDHLTEFGGLVYLAAPQDLRLGLEDTHDLGARVGDAFEDAKLGLRDHAPSELDHSPHLLNATL